MKKLFSMILVSGLFWCNLSLTNNVFAEVSVSDYDKYKKIYPNISAYPGNYKKHEPTWYSLEEHISLEPKFLILVNQTIQADKKGKFIEIEKKYIYNSKHNLFDFNKRKCRGNIIDPRDIVSPLCRELAKVEIDDTDITLKQFISDVFKHCNLTDNYFRDTSGKKLKLKNINAETCQISYINLTDYLWFSQDQYLSKGLDHFDKELVWKEKQEEEEKIAEAKEKQEEEKRKIAETKEKQEEEKRKIAETKGKQEEEKRIITEAKRKKIDEENKYNQLVKEFGDHCVKIGKSLYKKYKPGSPEHKKCLVDKKNEEEKKILAETKKKDEEKRKIAEAKKKEEEFLASLSAEEKRAYKCEKTFNFKKKSEKYNDCIFKLYEADLDLERLNLEKQKLELQKQIADQQNQQKLLNEQAEKDSLALEQKKTQDERAEAKAALAIEKQKLKAARALAEAARQQAYEAARQAEELRQANQIQRDIEQQKRARESLRQLQKQTRGECTILLGNC